MKTSVSQTDNGVQIRATVAPDKQQALLEEFAKCASGTCSCASTQYDRVELVDVAVQASDVTVNLKVKEGQTMDAAEIERCLDHTASLIGA